MARIIVRADDRYSWLDEVIARISGVYAPDFALVPAGKEKSYESKHGSCVKCTYRFIFTEAARQVLPNEEGMRLMHLIKSAARRAKADPPLVSTVIKGQHDFGDWGFDEEGGFMWIFLQAPKGERE